MIAAGELEGFAVMAEIKGQYPDFLYGSFQFQFHGTSCGNWKDEAHLNGCYHWLKKFSTTPTPRFEEGLMEISPREVFARLVTPVLVGMGSKDAPEIYDGTFARFHISHLGMSSFERVVMVLIEDSEHQRCVWAEGDAWKNGLFKEAVYPVGHMQQIAAEFCRIFKREAAKFGFLL